MSIQVAKKPSIPAIPLICLLCAIAGSVDATAYLLCGQIFVANMTGNTVLLAISILQGQSWKAALRGGLVASFLVGVISTRLLAKDPEKEPAKKERIFVLGIEVLLLLLLTWKSTGGPIRPLLLLLACMLGTQNTAFQYIGGFHLNTTFITGDLEKLGEALAGRKDIPTKASAFLLSWIGYAGGALLGALGARDFPDHGFLLPMILALVSVVAVTLTPDDSAASA